MKFDMHCHTKEGSIDSNIPIERYIELLKENGFDGMLVTDHDSYKGYYFWEENKDRMPADFIVLKGIEYDTTDAGHFIVIMPDDINLKILQIRGMSVSLLEKLVHHYGGILGPAHPFGLRSSSAMLFKRLKNHPSFVNKFDFIEGFNTCETIQANEDARELSENYDLLCTGGSDSHKEEYVGTGFTIFEQPITCNNDMIKCFKTAEQIEYGGKEREFLRKHKKRNSFYATWGFKAYNRSLSFICTPYRNMNLKKLDFHQQYRPNHQ